MEPRDQSLPTERNETPEWEEEIVAENKDTTRVEVDGGGVELGRGEDGEQNKETRVTKEDDRGLAKEEKPKAKKPTAVATQAQRTGGGDNEYILDGFDFSTGAIYNTICSRKF